MLKKSICLAVLLAVPLALGAGPAAADSWKNESGKHGHKYEGQAGNCKYEYKAGKHGFKEEYKCDGGHAHGYGPPPWAPAHGYRAKQGATSAYVPPFDLDLGRCNRELLGSLLGAAAGGLAGSQIGSGKGQLAAVAGGTLLGFLVGGNIGRGMDELDQNCIGQALEHAPDGQPIQWNNAGTGAQYQVVPTQTVQQSDGRYCREYQTTAVIAGKTQNTYGIACREPDGSWKLGG